MKTLDHTENCPPGCSARLWNKGQIVFGNYSLRATDMIDAHEAVVELLSSCPCQ